MDSKVCIFLRGGGGANLDLLDCSHPPLPGKPPLLPQKKFSKIDVIFEVFLGHFYCTSYHTIPSKKVSLSKIFGKKGNKKRGVNGRVWPLLKKMLCIL